MISLLVWLSALSFLFYGISYFTSQKLKDEFRRYGLAKFGPLTAVLEILGATGLVVGLQVPLILSVAFRRPGPADAPWFRGPAQDKRRLLVVAAVLSVYAAERLYFLRVVAD